MSGSGAEADVVVVCCANCGRAEVDDINLKLCDGCDLVKYCSDKCTKDHQDQHDEWCKKRKAELRDKELFTQPDGSHLGECPLCFLPMPLDNRKSAFYSCCSKTICDGCDYANYKNNGGDNCPFCREPLADDDDEEEKRMMKRIKANDPAALSEMGTMKRYNEADYDTAFSYLTKAAELGDIRAHYVLGLMYCNGEVERDGEKAVYHLEKAAIRPSLG